MKKVSIKTPSRKTAAARPESYRKQLQNLLRRLVQESSTDTSGSKPRAARR